MLKSINLLISVITGYHFPWLHEVIRASSLADDRSLKNFLKLETKIFYMNLYLKRLQERVPEKPILSLVLFPIVLIWSPAIYSKIR